MRYITVSLVIIVLLLAITVVTGSCGETTEEAGPTTGPVTTSEQWNADGVLGSNEYVNETSFGDFEVRWTSDDRNIYFGIKAKTEGWVSLGLDPVSQMEDADMIFGMVKDGEAVISDQFSTGAFGPHSPDTELGGSDDIVDFGGQEADGFTTIEFSRLLDTGDTYDNVLSEGTVKIIWAYGSADDFDVKHINDGSGEIKL
jgi:hypothetical protein